MVQPEPEARSLKRTEEKGGKKSLQQDYVIDLHSWICWYHSFHDQLFCSCILKHSLQVFHQGQALCVPIKREFQSK